MQAAGSTVDCRLFRRTLPTNPGPSAPSTHFCICASYSEEPNKQVSWLKVFLLIYTKEDMLILPWHRTLAIDMIWWLDLICGLLLSHQALSDSCDPMDWSTPGFPVLHFLPEFAQTHVPWVSDTIQPVCPLSSPSPSALNLSQHQDLFKWVSSSQQVAKVLGLQLQHQSFQWLFRVDFL